MQSERNSNKFRNLAIGIRFIVIFVRKIQFIPDSVYQQQKKISEDKSKLQRSQVAQRQ